MENEFDFNELKKQHANVFKNKEIDAVGNWTQPNFDTKTDEPAFLKEAIKKVEDLGSIVDDILNDM